MQIIEPCSQLVWPARVLYVVVAGNQLLSRPKRDNKGLNTTAIASSNENGYPNTGSTPREAPSMFVAIVFFFVSFFQDCLLIMVLCTSRLPSTFYLG